MTTHENSSTRNKDKEFEALWSRAMTFNQDVALTRVTGSAQTLPDLMMPQKVVTWIAELALRCHEKGLIDKTELDSLRQCSIDQKSIFDAIDTSRLKTVIATFQNN